jgi:hypothetical protein
MFLLSSPLRQILAVVLPVSFIWVFIACVTLCTEHGTKIQSHYASYSLTLTQDEDCCPIETAAPSVLPERRFGTVPASNYQQTAFSLAQFGEPALVHREHSGIPVSSSDPPFERLCTMRI